MGIFNFLKKFSKKEQETREIKLEELNSWLDSHSKQISENINPKLTTIKEKIIEEKNKIPENIEKLKTAQIKNPNIPERAKHIMEGNRKTYTERVNTLFKEINLPKELNKILEFCNIFNKSLDDFSKVTYKNYHILQEFFIEETTNISKNIRNIDNLLKKLKQTIEPTGLTKINELKNKANQIQEKIKQKQELENKIKKQKQELKKEDTTENQIKELEQSKKYKTYTKLTNKNKTLNQEITETENKISNSISLINPALKKYERLSEQDKLIRKYLDNPLKSLLEDKELKIIEVISKMKQSMIKGELELKKKKKDKILQILNNLTKDYLKTLIIKHNELNKELKILKEEINKTTIIKEINKLKDKLAQNKTKLKEQEEKIIKTTEELQKINIENLKTNLQNNIRKTINQEIKIL